MKNKTNKIITGTVVAVLAFTGIIWFARPAAKNNDPILVKIASAFTVEGGEKFDFGTISMAAGKVNHRFKIKNTANETVTINKMYTSCMCTTALLMASGGKQFGPYGMPGHGFTPSIDQAINSNEEVSVEVVFDPAAHGPAGVGVIQRSVMLENSAGQPVELQFSATVTP